MDIWRETLLTKKKGLEKEGKKSQEEEKAKADLYSKNVSARKLPKISTSTWPRFLHLWDGEVSNYSTEAQKVQVLRDSIVDKADRAATELMADLSAIMGYLFSPYGTLSTVCLQILDELGELGAPGDKVHNENNLVRILAAVTIFKQEDQMQLWSTSRISRIVNRTFTQKAKNCHWESFLSFN